MHTDFCVSLHAAATDACVRRDSPLTCRLAAWWCSRTLGSAEKTRWLQSAASRLPWGPDLGWLTPGCVGKQTHTQKKGWVNKQTMPAGGNTRPRRQRFEQLSSLCQRHRQGDMIYWPLGTRTCQWLLFMEIPPCRAPPCLRLLFLKAHNSVACLFFFFFFQTLRTETLQHLAHVLQHLQYIPRGHRKKMRFSFSHLILFINIRLETERHKLRHTKPSVALRAIQFVRPTQKTVGVQSYEWKIHRTLSSDRTHSQIISLLSKVNLVNEV